MAANSQKKAAELARSRVRARQRKQARGQWMAEPVNSGWQPDDDHPPRQFAINKSTGEVQFLGEQTGVRKLSDILLEMVEPLRSFRESDEQLLALAKIAALGWNATLVAPKTMAKIFREEMERAPIAMKVLIISMSRHKQENFPDDCRYIIDLRISHGRGEPTLQVLSTPVPDHC